MKALLGVLLCLSSVLVNAQEEPPRLRTLLPNGSILLVENLPRAKSVSVQLFASDRRLPDTPDNHGFRHLLEHLCLKGPKHDLDLQMERQGMFFLGRTLRDAMQIEFTCSPKQIPVALDGLKQALQPISVTQQEITKEVGIMKQELALETDTQRLARAAWTEAYGDQGLDPFGELATMEKATPQALADYQTQLFAPNNLVLVISGPLDIEAVTKIGKGFLEDFSGRASGTVAGRPDGVPGRADLNDAFGEARGARVPGWQSARTAWTLAAAFGVASQVASPFVIYTPSAGNGLVVLGQTDDNSGIGMKIDSMEQGDVAALFPIGKLLARRWLLRQLEEPSSSAFIRGLLLCDGPSNRPEQMLANIDSMTWQDFLRGFVGFRQDAADVAVGSRSMLRSSSLLTPQLDVVEDPAPQKGPMAQSEPSHQPTILEIPEKGASYTTVQAIVQTGSIEGRDRAYAKIVADTLLDGSQDFNKYRLLQYSTLAGERMRCTLSPDHFRIQLEVPNGQLMLGAEIMSDLLRNARLDDESVTDALAKAPFRASNYWAEALAPFKLNFSHIKRASIQAFYEHTFTPDNTSIAVLGDFKPGDAKAAFSRYLSDWTAPRPRRRELPEPDTALARHGFPLTTVGFEGSQFAGTDDALPTQLLTATALGVGKWSSMHRVLRERLGLSYRQEAVLTPTPLGFRLQLVFARAPGENESSLADQARAALQADVQTWNEDVRQRALGMAEAYLLNGAPVSPLDFDDLRPIGSNLEDETFMQAYWRAKVGKAWDPHALLEQMKAVSLEQMKAAATALLKDAPANVITGG